VRHSDGLVDRPGLHRGVGVTTEATETTRDLDTTGWTLCLRCQHRVHCEELACNGTHEAKCANCQTATAWRTGVQCEQSPRGVT
jgi:hypothetical protein